MGRPKGSTNSIEKQLVLIGQKFNHLRTIDFAYMKNHNSYFVCTCDCGNKKIIQYSKLKNGHTKSCGCIGGTHKMYQTRIYRILDGMKQRCGNPKHKAYHNYGGRGIKICDSWNKFENFRDDMYKSYLKHCKKFGEQQTSIDRIDNDGNYKLSNCRWATRSEQNLNTIYNQK